MFASSPARLRVASSVASALIVLASARASGQLIQLKTLPLADGDQWRIFPSASGSVLI